MKKYIDWDKVEKETGPAEEACECTRSKLQSLIDFVAELFPKKTTPLCGDKTNETGKGKCNDN